MKKLIGFMLVLQILLCFGLAAAQESEVDINSLDYIDAVKMITEKELKNKAENIVIGKSTYGKAKEKADNVTIQYLATESYWDSTDFVRTAFSHYVNICSQAYEHEDAIEIYFQVKAEVTDSNGWPAAKTLIYLLMPIENFEQYNWAELKNINLNYKDFQKHCKTFSIQSPIEYDFDVNKFYYLGESGK